MRLSQSLDSSQAHSPRATPWCEISEDEVVDQGPSLADRVALQGADNRIEETADEIAAMIFDV